MSSSHVPPPPAPQPPPPIGPVLRYYGPWIGGLALLLIVVVAYAELRARVEALEIRMDARVEPEPERAPRPPAAGTIAPEDGSTTDPARPTITRDAPPPTWPCEGVLSQDAVRQSIGRHGPAVLRCFEQRSAQAPELRGTLMIRLRVGADGHVSAAHVAGIDDEPLTTCVGDDVLSWVFTAPEGGDCAVVEAPFALGARAPRPSPPTPTPAAP